jgi:TM2 domain-containing membrane protein YozV
MDAQTVDLFLMANSKYLEDHQMYLIRERLIAMDESKWRMLQFMQFNDPVIILIVSLITGPLAIDRFMIGDTGLGVLKLITCGGLGIWMLVDWVIIMGITRRKNTEKLMMAIY